MSERIKELAEQADDFADKKLQMSGEYHPDWHDIRDEKFAELIVRECMKESMEEIVSDDEIAQEKDPLIREYLNGNNQGIVDAVVRFRNHFGVKE